MRWLRLGWQDLNHARGQSLVYGTSLAVFAFLVTALAWAAATWWRCSRWAWVRVEWAGAGVSACIPSAVSWNRGRSPRLGMCLVESRNHLRNELLFALVMLVVLLIWARAASMVRVFPVGEDLSMLDWLQFLAVGSAVGAVFATIVFASSVVALPMMLDRGTDAITVR